MIVIICGEAPQQIYKTIPLFFMRLWSIHPKYLDAKGLVALWREGLLAKKVLENKTKGYKSHPQLQRFKQSRHTLTAVNFYLHAVCDEADARGYSFDRSKLSRRKAVAEKIPVSTGQINCEWQHLMSKLKQRSPADHARLKKVAKIQVHPLFRRVTGVTADWEVTE